MAERGEIGGKMHSGAYSSKHECLLCGDVITNPICYTCLESEVKDWLEDRMPQLVPTVKKTGRMFASYAHQGTRCILCGDNMNVCTHCYCYEVNKLFQNYPRLAEEFVEFFNFELRGSSRVAVI
ncbi:TPA: hypothetical protein HA231_03350 [Candidatus Woesearchaeota archaeon]|nr:hypothetical protein [Candidatus Woesearchaeota archaeon]